jgi:CRP-like cAMP-binding protein
MERTKNRKFVLEKNQTQLAEYFGVARPSVARCLSEMIEDKIITLQKNHGEVLNPNALKEFVMQ